VPPLLDNFAPFQNDYSGLFIIKTFPLVKFKKCTLPCF
jgi:hypothetical protein